MRKIGVRKRQLLPPRLFVAVLLVLVTTVFAGAQTGESVLSFPEGLEYDPFFAVLLTDSDGTAFRLFDAASFEGPSLPWPDSRASWGDFPGSGPGEEMRYFFWVRRGGETGTVTYPLSFSKIVDIVFTGDYGEETPSFTPATLTLSDGSVFDVQIKADGYLGGIDEAFGTYAMAWMAHGEVRRITFLHDGRYHRCPFCGALFYDSDSEACPFDGTTLVPQS